MRILILRHIEKNSMDDIFHQTDYSSYEWVKSTNVGNKLWLMGLISTISTSENQIDFLESYMDADYINSNYDICIKPEANIFSPRFRDGMERHVERYKEVKIPIYVIACGAAAKNYDDLDELCQAIRDPATAFIRQVYKTGGEFCLRGYFTKAMFDRLGFHDAVVTGCPSLYQLGRNLNISNEKVPLDQFKVALNGTMRPIEKIMSHYSNTVFIDQGIYWPIMYSEKYELSDKSSVKQYSLFGIKKLEADRIKLWVDIQDWADYLVSQDFSFSFGSRIHGNILPILCGIPAVICPPDARVKEMAEFYEIPMISKNDIKKRDLYEIYSNTNYAMFNKNYAAKYDAYGAFLKERGIVKKINDKPLLRVDESSADVNRLSQVKNNIHIERIKELSDRVSHNLGLLAYDYVRKAFIDMSERLDSIKK